MFVLSRQGGPYRRLSMRPPERHVVASPGRQFPGRCVPILPDRPADMSARFFRAHLGRGASAGWHGGGFVAAPEWRGSARQGEEGRDEPLRQRRSLRSAACQ